MPHSSKKSEIQPIYLRLRDIAAYLNLGYSSIYHLRDHDPTFPKARALTGTAVGWLREEVEEWAKNRPVAATHARGVSKAGSNAAA